MNEPEPTEFGWCEVKGKQIYYPSPQEIATKCLEIQSCWQHPSEFRKRAPHAFTGRVIAAKRWSESE